MKVTVVGSGPGGLAIAADMATRGGHDVVLTDLPEFPTGVEAVADRGGVEVASGWFDRQVIPLQAHPDVADAVSETDQVLISVRAPGHRRFAALVAENVQPGTPILFFGEGGGAIAMWSELERRNQQPRSIVGETNCLPFISRSLAPGAITVDRKHGGVLLSSIPGTRVEEAHALIAEIWPFIEATDSIWTTMLLNFDAIDTVPTAIANVGAIESRPGGFLLWGEGATRSVVRLIEALDSELRSLRLALGSRDERRFQDFLAAQGLATPRDTLYDTIRNGSIMRSVRPAGDEAALVRLLELDVPWTLVLASSVGEAVGVPTPTADAIIALTSAFLARDVRAEGRTLDTLGLSGLDKASLMQLSRTGSAKVP